MQLRWTALRSFVMEMTKITLIFGLTPNPNPMEQRNVQCKDSSTVKFFTLFLAKLPPFFLINPNPLTLWSVVRIVLVVL